MNNINEMTIMSFATGINSWGRHDGDEFVRQMIMARRVWENAFDSTVLTSKLFEKRPWKRRREFSEKLKAKSIGVGEVDCFAFFMHGSWKWLHGIGYHLWNVDQLADRILEYSFVPNIILYSCSCGRGKWGSPKVEKRERSAIYGVDGFAHMLSASLANEGAEHIISVAHTGAGHTTWYPRVVSITTDPVSGITESTYLEHVIKKQLGKSAWKEFARQMRTTDLKFKLPFISEDEIVAMLDKSE